MNPIPKQIIVVRKDLNMRKGKIAAQAAHASMKVLLDLQISKNNEELVLNLPQPAMEWVNGIFTKICVSVNSEEELLNIHQKAKEAGILTSLITDSGATEFHGVPTNTVVAIGPDYPHNIDPLTKHLPLL